MTESSSPATGSVAAASTTAGTYPQRWKALGVLVVGLLLVILDNTILNVAIPILSKQRLALPGPRQPSN